MAGRLQPAATSSNRRAPMEGPSMRPPLSRACPAFQAVSRVGAAAASVMARAWPGWPWISSAADAERPASAAVVGRMQRQSGRKRGLGLWGVAGAVAGGLAAGAGAAHLLYTRGHR